MSREIRFEVSNCERSYHLAKPGALMRIPGSSATVRVKAVEHARSPDRDACTVVAEIVGWSARGVCAPVIRRRPLATQLTSDGWRLARRGVESAFKKLERQ